MSYPGTRLSAQSQDYVMLLCQEPKGLSAPGGHDLGQSLTEDLLRAGIIMTPKLTHAQRQADPPIGPG
jgi:hypothetical protein